MAVTTLTYWVPCWCCMLPTPLLEQAPWHAVAGSALGKGYCWTDQKDSPPLSSSVTKSAGFKVSCKFIWLSKSRHMAEPFLRFVTRISNLMFLQWGKRKRQMSTTGFCWLGGLFPTHMILLEMGRCHHLNGEWAHSSWVRLEGEGWWARLMQDDSRCSSIPL